jgi:hypothetical protein
MRRYLISGAALLIGGLALALAGCSLALPGGTPTTTASKTPASSSSATFGPPATVPLPAGSSLAQQTAPSGFLSPRIWVYTAPNTDARTLEAYYSKTLPPKGWSDYRASFDKTSAGEVVTITAKQDGTGLQITISPGTTQTPAGSLTVRISEQPVGT